MKQIIMTALFMLLPVSILGQQTHQIKGIVKSGDENLPLEFANIVLRTSADSTFITGTNSDEKGRFKLDQVKQGDYQVAISSLGYETAVISVQGLSQNIDLGTIALQSSSYAINEVTVKASAVRSYSDRRDCLSDRTAKTKFHKRYQLAWQHDAAEASSQSDNQRSQG